MNESGTGVLERPTDQTARETTIEITETSTRGDITRLTVEKNKKTQPIFVATDGLENLSPEQILAHVRYQLEKVKKAQQIIDDDPERKPEIDELAKKYADTLRNPTPGSTILGITGDPLFPLAQQSVYSQMFEAHGK